MEVLIAYASMIGILAEEQLAGRLDIRPGVLCAASEVLNDSVCVDKKAHSCDLPFHVLDSIPGWMEDALSLPAANGYKVEVQPLVFNRIIDIIPVSGWHVVQQPDNGLVGYYRSPAAVP